MESTVKILFVLMVEDVFNSLIQTVLGMHQAINLELVLAGFHFDRLKLETYKTIYFPSF